MVILALASLVAMICLALAYRLFIAALHWLPGIWCGLYTAYYVVSLHLDDPLASLWAFLATAFGGRFVMGRLRDWLLQRRFLR